MSNTYKSSSTEQMQAEEYIFKKVEEKLQISLDRNKKIFLADNSYTYMQPDFISEKELIVGEIFAHIGKPKKAQDNKISNDILKMLLLERVTGNNYRKVIVVCDKEEEKKLKGLSVLAESIRQFDIEVIRIEIDEAMKEKICNAQKRQKMINIE